MTRARPATTPSAAPRGAVRALIATASAVAVAGALAVPATAAPPRSTATACPADEVPDPGFADDGGPFEAAIGCVAWYGLTEGRTPARFEPGGEVTRGQLASFTRSLVDAALADGFPVGDGRTGFTDVDPSGPHAPAIDALASADPPVLEGYDTRRFGPQDRVTRAQAASIVHRALRTALPDLAVGEDPTCGFPDADRITPVHRRAIADLCALGVAAGRDDGRFDPSAGILRGQAAAFLARSLDVVAEEGELQVPWQVTTLATGLDQPWEVVRTTDGRTYVTERRGTLSELVDGELVVRRTFDVTPSGEGGLLGLAQEPSGDRRLFAYVTTDTDNRVVAFDPDDGPNGEVTTVVNGIPRAIDHDGGRLAFGPDGNLYIATGDAAANDETARPTADQLRAQELGSYAGKILRVTPDGGRPDDNPFGNLVYSLGHRNVQGLAFDADGRLWATELGPDEDDEVNRIVAGGNYGWPHVTGTATRGGDFRPAAFVRQPHEASWSGATFTIESVGFAGRDTLLIGALRGQRLWRLATTGTEVTGSASLFEGDLGRVRSVVPSGDGGVLVLTGNGGDQDRLLRIGRPR